MLPTINCSMSRSIRSSPGEVEIFTRFRDWPISRDMADEQSSPFSRDREDDRFMVVVMVLRCLVVGSVSGWLVAALCCYCTAGKSER